MGGEKNIHAEKNHIAEQSEGSQIRVPMKLSLRAGIGVLLTYVK